MWKQPYKIVTEISAGVDKRDSINPGLDRMARLVNLYTHAGVAKGNIDMYIMIHFTATPIILSDEAYQKKFGMPNPNTALINEMAANGVKFYVCGQSIYKRKVNKEPRNPNIKVVLSAMYGITTLQMKGYAFMP
jgi:intracellular sulfur oxidation DsrE/DsrF family protein